MADDMSDQEYGDARASASAANGSSAEDVGKLVQPHRRHERGRRGRGVILLARAARALGAAGGRFAAGRAASLGIYR